MVPSDALSHTSNGPIPPHSCTQGPPHNAAQPLLAFLFLLICVAMVTLGVATQCPPCFRRSPKEDEARGAPAIVHS